MKNAKLKKRATVWAVHALLGLWLIYSLLPPVMLLAASLNSTALFRSPLDLLLLRDFTLDNFWFFFTNSLIISGAAVVITLVVCVPLAYGLTKILGRAHAAVSYGVLAMRFIPYVVLALPMFLIFVNLGLSGSRTGLLLAHLSIHIPFATWMLVGFIAAVTHVPAQIGLANPCEELFLHQSGIKTWIPLVAAEIPQIKASAIGPIAPTDPTFLCCAPHSFNPQVATGWVSLAHDTKLAQKHRHVGNCRTLDI